MYIHVQYCYNLYVLNRHSTICMYRHGTYPGLPGNVPQIPYSLHMLTTLGKGLLGLGKGILGQLGTLILYDFV